jgi:hypothetical protein
MEYYSVIRKTELMSFAEKSANLLRKISQVQKAKYYMFLLICET